MPSSERTESPSVPAANRLAREVGFLIVGTPRSGTTMMRRLACEVPGVRVPNETHFFHLFVRWHLDGVRFPLGGDDLRAALTRFASLDTSRVLGVDVDRVAGELGERCGSPLELFDALVRNLSGPALVYGEKTPDHLVWWRALTRARPWMKLVCVIRDPRAVAASQARQAWGQEARLLADRWAFDARQIRLAHTALGPSRCLVLRYEDVVVDPVATKGQLATFLGVDRAGELDESLTRFPTELFMRMRPEQAIVKDSVAAWRSTLPPRHAAFIAARCRAEMLRLGYTDDVPSRAAAAVQLAKAGPAAALAAVRLQRRNLHRLRFADRFDLEAGAGAVRSGRDDAAGARSA